jgi:single-strand DNA-binding protein
MLLETGMFRVRIAIFSNRNMGRNFSPRKTSNKNKTKDNPDTYKRRNKYQMTQLTITGNVVADPDLRVLPSGKTISTFTVVSSKSVKQANGTWENTDTTFWDIKCWNKLGDNVADCVTKGMSVIVVGTAIQENWDDKTTGAKRSKMAVTAWSVGIDLKRHYTKAELQSPVERVSGKAAIQDDPWTVPLNTNDVAPF